MHLFFIDESGTPPNPGAAEASRYFVVGGVIIPDRRWRRVHDAFQGIKTRFHVRGEIKWRYFAPGNDDPKNPMRAMDHATRSEIRRLLFGVITSDPLLKTIACVCSTAAAYEMPSINTQEDLYHGTYKPITERFQYYLQDVSEALGSTQYGMILADHRGRQDDKRLQGHHQKLLYSTGAFISKYDNLVEGLFLTPSNLSIGIQLADLVAGAVWRRFEREDATSYDLMEPSLRRNSAGNVAGYGIVKFPKANWR